MYNGAQILLKPPPSASQGWALAPGSVNEEKVRRGSGRKDFLGAFADLNSGFRIRTDNMGNAPAEQIAHSEEGGAV